MLTINGEVLELNHFPDGTLHLIPNFETKEINIIKWHYENEEELIALIYITNYLKEYGGKENELQIPYIPNARMDRIKTKRDVFTLKYFANIINSLGFTRVLSIDPHSSVSEALINKLCSLDLNAFVKFILRDININENIREDDLIIYFPDNGASKKYEDLFRGFKLCYGVKHRDWTSGKILGLEVITNEIDLKGKTVLMFDDICSYGGSLYYGANKLKQLGAGEIYAYVSHCENSILDREKGTLIKSLEDGTVEKLFTTDSIFTGEHEKITVLGI